MRLVRGRAFPLRGGSYGLYSPEKYCKNVYKYGWGYENISLGTRIIRYA